MTDAMLQIIRPSPTISRTIWHHPRSFSPQET